MHTAKNDWTVVSSELEVKLTFCDMQVGLLSLYFPAVFEPAIPASEWSQTHALDRATTGIGTGITFRKYLQKNLI
jgi:hypothetical protein